MSVLVTMRVPGDTSQFRTFLATESDRLRKTREQAQTSGCVHHRFGVGDGFVLVVDEWESSEQVRGFFEGKNELAQLIRDAGGQGAPDITFTEAVESPDQF